MQMNRVFVYSSFEQPKHNDPKLNSFTHERSNWLAIGFFLRSDTKYLCISTVHAKNENEPSKKECQVQLKTM